MEGIYKRCYCILKVSIKSQTTLALVGMSSPVMLSTESSGAVLFMFTPNSITRVIVNATSRYIGAARAQYLHKTEYKQILNI